MSLKMTLVQLGDRVRWAGSWLLPTALPVPGVSPCRHGVGRGSARTPMETREQHAGAGTLPFLSVPLCRCEQQSRMLGLSGCWRAGSGFQGLSGVRRSPRSRLPGAGTGSGDGAGSRLRALAAGTLTQQRGERSHGRASPGWRRDRDL